MRVAVDLFAAVFLADFFATFRTSSGATALGSGGVPSSAPADWSLCDFGFRGTQFPYRCDFRLQALSKGAYRQLVRHFLFRWLVTTVAVIIASSFIRGIRYDSVGALVAAALLLGILNAFVRPLLLLISAPLILFSLGLFVLVINGVMLLTVPTFVWGFHVDSFASAFWGAIVIGIVSWLLSAFFRGSDGRVYVLTHHSQVKRVPGRVIR
jgi:putative membrane protein